MRRVRKDLIVAKQCRRPAGVQEDNTLALLEPTLPAIVDQTCCAFAGIDWIEQYPLELGKHAHRFDRVLSRNAITRTNIVAVGAHILTLHHIGAAKFGGRLCASAKTFSSCLACGAPTPNPSSGISALIACNPTTNPA